MKRVFALFILIILLISPVLALDLTVKKLSQNEVMVVGIDRPARFTLQITNNGTDEILEFYNLLGFSMFPIGTIPLKALETKEIEVSVKPIGEFDQLGPYTFSYYIRGLNNGSEIKRTLTFNRIEIKDAFEIGASSFDPDSNSIEIYVKNLQDFNFETTKAELSSSFFSVEEEFQLGPKELKNITVELNKEDFKQLMAGFYTLNAEIDVSGIKTTLSTNLEFEEKNIIRTEEHYGFIVSTDIIRKINEGNAMNLAQVTLNKNIISRLFTGFDPEPDTVERQGFSILYTWNKPINPGESFEVTVKTNWIFPILIIILIIVIVILVKQYSKQTLVLKKKVGFVKTKGGEFALKVTIYVNAKKYIENVSIYDRLPPLVKIYENFGVEVPKRVDQKSRRIEWGFEKLEPGEIRMISYVIYSKVGVMGKFSLPSTRGIFEKDGRLHEAESNRAFFVSEQITKEPEEE